VIHDKELQLAIMPLDFSVRYSHHSLERHTVLVTLDVLIIDFGWEIDLGRLINRKEAGNGSVRFHEVAVKPEHRRQVITNPILAASHLVQCNGAISCVRYDCEATDVKTRR